MFFGYDLTQIDATWVISGSADSASVFHTDAGYEMRYVRSVDVPRGT